MGFRGVACDPGKPELLGFLDGTSDGNDAAYVSPDASFRLTGSHVVHGHGLCVAFEGEIYDAPRVRNVLGGKGCDFASDTTGELVLHGFRTQGVDFFRTIEGPFVCAIYEEGPGRLTLVRDRLGYRQAYHARRPDAFVFSTDLGALAGSGFLRKEIDGTALSRYLQLTYVPAPATIFSGISKLCQRSFLRVDRRRDVVGGTYYRFDFLDEPAVADDFETCRRTLREVAYRAVERRLACDGLAKGTLLSGGFDSAIVTGIVAELSGTKVDSFTVGFDDIRGYDETRLAELAARRNGCVHHVLRFRWENIAGQVDDILSRLDEPYADSSLLASWAISREAKQHVDVVMTGDGGDEVFAGYNKYLIGYCTRLYGRIPGFLRRGVVEPLVRRLPPVGAALLARKFLSVASLTPSEQRKRLMSLGFKPEELRLLMPGGAVDDMAFVGTLHDEHDRDEQTRTQYVDLNAVIEGDMLPKAFLTGRMTGIVTRSPLLDMEVVEAALRMPTSFRIKGRRRKIVLKETFRDKLPPEFFSAPKHGFGVPIEDWLRKGLRERLLAYADEAFLREQGLFDHSYIDGMIRAHLSGRENRYSELWAFFVFQNWYARVFMHDGATETRS